jgi:hypothetical protein
MQTLDSAYLLRNTTQDIDSSGGIASAVMKAIRVGENVIDHVTSRQLPPDKLSAPLDGLAE